MATVTLAESAKLTQDDLVAGVIEEIIDVDAFFELLPFEGIEGNAISFNRENVLGDVEVLGVGSAIAAKNPASFNKVSVSLTTIIGDAEVNGLIQATRSDYTDQTAVQVASKAKSAGRKYRDMLINGTGAANQFSGLLTVVDAGQVITAGANGAALAFSMLDELLDSVKDKDGKVDFILMHPRTHRSFKALLRAIGGATIDEVLKLPSGKTVLMYEGVPVFKNDWIPTNQVQGTSGAVCTSVIAGTFDDGSRTHGIAGLTAKNAAGLQVKNIGESETKDEEITRVKWYCSLANFATKGLAVLKGLTN